MKKKTSIFEELKVLEKANYQSLDEKRINPYKYLSTAFREDDWTPIRGWETRYLLHKDGRVYSIRKHKLLRQQLSTHGYPKVMLWSNYKHKNYMIHRLLAEHFIPNPNLNKTSINHIDGNILNNSLDNLEWCTQKENIKNSIDRGTFKPVKFVKPGVPPRPVEGIKDGKKTKYLSIMEASRQTNTIHQNIHKVCNGQRHTAGGYEWRYVNP